MIARQRAVLDQQMKDRRNEAAKRAQEKKEMDSMILKKAEQEMAQERQKQSELKVKML